MIALNLLDAIPGPVFEGMGTAVGLAGCSIVLVQVLKEWRSPERSSLAMTYVAGWFFIFLFWLSYGIRFRAIAIWLPNSIALILQLALLVVVIRKRTR